MKIYIDDAFGEALLETPHVSLYMLAREVSSNFPGSDTLSDFANGLTIAQELDGLRRDLVRLERGWKPAREDLTDSTALLTDWGIWDAGEELPRIVGHCSEASRIGAAFAEGQQIATLQILAIDHNFAWVRDRRGFYRLATGQLPRRAFRRPESDGVQHHCRANSLGHAIH